MTSRLLIVDDEKTFLVATQAGLAAEGHEVRTASSAAEALSVARAFQPDVVVLDRHLPDGDGFSVLQQLRTELGADAPVVVMVTADRDVVNALYALRAGAFEYLAKPLQLPTLILAVEKALAARRRRQPDA